MIAWASQKHKDSCPVLTQIYWQPLILMENSPLFWVNFNDIVTIELYGWTMQVKYFWRLETEAVIM